MSKQVRRQSDTAPGLTTPDRRRDRVLVVEPETLLRWSIVTYLRRWCDVVSAESVSAAERFLEARNVDAVILADDLGDDDAGVVEAYARAANAAVRIVRTGVERDEAHHPGERALFVEKPFELSKLVEMLGLDAPAAGTHHPAPAQRKAH